MPKTAKIPKAAITRLSIYYRQLEYLESKGCQMVSSEKLAGLCHVNSAQVRKDLGYFGEFGIRGVGYDVVNLLAQLKNCLALNRNWNIGLVGVGRLGAALLHYQNVSVRGFRCVAAFDNNPALIGKIIPHNLVIRDIKDLCRVVQELNIEIGVITTPPEVAQGVAELFLKAGVNAMLNFSPARIRVPDSCLVENIDFTVKLDILTYKISHGIGL
ncbi:MAG: redox-sensing transcriptional repressor Rex [Deltaproteobacteria bacterium]|nr:redox-sensing transcriptional repressor Rex [Deltaproteobacteria bacterium]